MKGLRPANMRADDIEWCYIPSTDSVIHGLFDAVVSVGAAAIPTTTEDNVALVVPEITKLIVAPLPKILLTT